MGMSDTSMAADTSRVSPLRRSRRRDTLCPPSSRTEMEGEDDGDGVSHAAWTETAESGHAAVLEGDEESGCVALVVLGWDSGAVGKMRFALDEDAAEEGIAGAEAHLNAVLPAAHGGI